MNVTDPIRRVSVVSTGQVQIRPDHLASTWRPTYLWLLSSRSWTGPRPINAYVIEHRDGLLLFDTGQDRASVTDPGYFPGGVTGVLYDRLARFEIGPQETLSAGLDRLGYAVSDVRTAVISHLHQDHIGGLAELSDAEIVARLVTVRGVGRWTAEMFLLFQLRRLDVWPVGDLGVRRGYGLAWQVPTPTARELQPLGEVFRPYRSVAAWYCWRAAELYAEIGRAHV